MWRTLRSWIALSWCCTHSGTAYAFLLHEHGEIGREAVSQVSRPEDRDALERAWRDLQRTTPHLCPGWDEPWASRDGRGSCISLAVLPAIAGDHSCSLRNLREVADTPWSRRIIAIAAEIQAQTAPTRERRTAEDQPADRVLRLDLRRDFDRRLIMEDDDFLTRAQANPSHFTATRTAGSLAAYLRHCLQGTETLNSIGVYVALHATALRLARETPNRPSQPGEALLTELYALHFLEDSFAAGHIVGSWGDGATRSGTHDYYCLHGVDAQTWSGERYVAYGDGFMTDEDRQRAGAAAAVSLQQFACALRGAPDQADPQCEQRLRGRLAHVTENAPALPMVNTCTDPRMPPGFDALVEDAALFEEVLKYTPVPSLRDPSPPRFYNELGFSVGAQTEVQGNGQWAGSVDAPYVIPNQGSVRALGMVTLGLSFRGGMPRFVDSRVWFGAGLTVDLGMDGLPQTGVRFGGHLPIDPLEFLWGLGRLMCPSRLSSCGEESALSVLLDGVAGSVYPGRVHRHFILRDNWTFQVVLGREFWATRLLASGNTSAAWSFTIPVLRFQGSTAGGGRLTSEFIGTLGAEVTLTDPGEVRGGIYLSAGLAGRYLFGGT